MGKLVGKLRNEVQGRVEPMGSRLRQLARGAGKVGEKLSKPEAVGDILKRAEHQVSKVTDGIRKSENVGDILRQAEHRIGEATEAVKSAMRFGGDSPVHQRMREIGQAARRDSQRIAAADTATRNGALLHSAEQLEAQRELVLAANAEDMTAAREAGLSDAMLDRLQLTSERLEQMIAGLRAMVELPDPLGAVTERRKQPSGIEVGRMRVPLGVVCIIYESRPNVTADAAGLALKAGNAVILRGGSEALRSNRAIADCMQAGLAAVGLPKEALQMVDTSDRAAVGALITMPEYIDVLIPRGGKSLVARLQQEARVPLLKHLDGVCHVYVDAAADLDMAEAIAVNSKTQRFGVCNAIETLLVHGAVAETLLPRLAERFLAAGVELRGCPYSCQLLEGIEPATEEDWSEEYLGPVLALRVVSSLDHAIEHINHYGSGHTDAIVTEDSASADRFLREVDSGSVMHNASTRFADGFEYGLGAEIGISTDKLHARGPVGLEGLTSQKFIVLGTGQVRTA